MVILAGLIAAPWTVAALPAVTDTPVAASVAYTYFTPAFQPPALKIGDECFVPLKLVSRLGWSYVSSGNRATVSVAGKQVETFVRLIGSEKYIPARAVVAGADGISEWGRGNDLHIYARVVSIRGFADRIDVKTTLPVRATASAIDGPNRIVMDLAGARLQNTAVEGEVRFAQFNSDTVRIVSQVDGPASVPTRFEIRSAWPSVGWTGAKAVAMEGVGGIPVAGPEPVAAANTKPPATFAIFVGTPILTLDTAKRTTIRIPIKNATQRKVSTIRDKDGTYWINIPGGRQMADAKQMELTGQVVRSARLVDNPSGVSLRMELARTMGVRVAPASSEIVIDIVQPRNGFGTLSTKKIVIDAGHGKSDSGAKWGSLFEKNITLPIAKLVAEGLTENGTMVLMTRVDDSYPSLPERPAMANDSQADFFISIHINSNQLGDKSGTYTYYHFDDSDSKLLAQCIQAEIAKVSGLPDNGVASDRTVAKTKGFAVLRGSRMPAVLVEVAYINHPGDRSKLLDIEFRKKIAAAIIKGIKSYIGEQEK